MTGFILTCLLIGFGFAAILMGLVKSATNGKGKGRPASDSMDDITNPSHRWHPLNMWHDD